MRVAQLQCTIHPAAHFRAHYLANLKSPAMFLFRSISVTKPHLRVTGGSRSHNRRIHPFSRITCHSACDRRVLTTHSSTSIAGTTKVPDFHRTHSLSQTTKSSANRPVGNLTGFPARAQRIPLNPCDTLLRMLTASHPRGGQPLT